jgi:hypothetical protein
VVSVLAINSVVLGVVGIDAINQISVQFFLNKGTYTKHIISNIYHIAPPTGPYYLYTFVSVLLWLLSYCKQRISNRLTEASAQ